MRIALSVLAYIGAILVVLGTVLVGVWVKGVIDGYPKFDIASYGYFTAMGLVGVALGSLLTCSGTLLALIGGLIAKPRFLWILLILTGLFSELPFLWSFHTHYVANLQELHQRLHIDYDIFRNGLLSLMYILPGIVCVTEGISLLVIGQVSVKSKEQSSQNKHF